MNAIRALRIKRETMPTYPLRVASNHLLKRSKKRSRILFVPFSFLGFSISAQSAGVSVSATKAEIAIEIAIVRANCL